MRRSDVCGAALLGVFLAGPAFGQAVNLGLPPPDPVSIWTLQDENSSISTARLTDRYYTNGLRLGWVGGTDFVPAFLDAFSEAVMGPGRTRLAFDLSQQIYTPADTQLVPPDPRDRPYAGVLLGNFSIINDTLSGRTVLGLSAGLVGPGAGGENLQNGFHDLIGQSHDLGWGYQIKNTPLVEALAEHIWRVPVTTLGPLETDVLPEVTAGAGNLRLYAQAGATIRLGQGLDSDFGTNRLRPGLSGTDAFVPTRPFAWYVFAGADGQLVGYDILLESNPFRGGLHVPEKWDVGELQGGLALMAFGARLTYTHVVQTQEFHGQHGGLHQFGSLALSVRF